MFILNKILNKEKTFINIIIILFCIVSSGLYVKHGQTFDELVILGSSFLFLIIYIFYILKKGEENETSS